jgi:TonB family protein
MFEPLEAGKSRWKQFMAGWSILASIMTVVALIPILFPQAIPQEVRHYIAMELAPYVPPVPQTPQPRVHIKQAPVPVPDTPPVHALVVPSAPHKTQPEEVRPPEIAMKDNAPAPVMSTGSSAKPTLAKQPIKVQTGGFGDPNGVAAAKSNSNAPVNIAASGSFDLPKGEGHGNGTGGKNGVPGVTLSTGFGNGTAVQQHSKVAVTGNSSFDTFSKPDTGTAIKKEAPTTPVEIVSKPEPQYTAEGRALRINGSVRLEVVFTAMGEVVVNRVLTGLGHGLDEQAKAAAQRIKFKPAQREGQAVDSTAVISIVFQLAS